jgi:hypothetical protein
VSIDRREFQRLCELAKANGWRVELTQHQNGKLRKVVKGSHVHSVFFPPDPAQHPVPVAITTSPTARRNVYAGLRRAGLEPDPCRQQRRAAKQRRQE